MHLQKTDSPGSAENFRAINQKYFILKYHIIKLYICQSTLDKVRCLGVDLNRSARSKTSPRKSKSRFFGPLAFVFAAPEPSRNVPDKSAGAWSMIAWSSSAASEWTVRQGRADWQCHGGQGRRAHGRRPDRRWNPDRFRGNACGPIGPCAPRPVRYLCPEDCSSRSQNNRGRPSGPLTQ